MGTYRCYRCDKEILGSPYQNFEMKGFMEEKVVFTNPHLTFCSLGCVQLHIIELVLSLPSKK